MKFCKYCGSQIGDSARFCPHCGKELQARDTEVPAPDINKPVSAFGSKLGFVGSWLKKPVVWVVLAAIIVLIIVLVVAGSGRCDYGSCKNKAISGYDYCYTHKCAVDTCNDASTYYSNFCYYHALLYDDNTSDDNSSYVPSYQLKISDVKVYTSGNYTYAEGSVTNNSDTTVTFLKIKGSFKNYSGTVVDTDWTYAVGSEGLAPGESCKWSLSVKKDYSITDCDVSVFDYDY